MFKFSNKGLLVLAKVDIAPKTRITSEMGAGNKNLPPFPKVCWLCLMPPILFW